MIGPKARAFAESRETSNEVAQAILDAANSGRDAALRIWETPTEEELNQVKAAAWSYSSPFETVLHWGAMSFERAFA